MNASQTPTALQPGQHYDPGYEFPALAIGQALGSTGRTVIAAIRETDTPGYLPGLHTVVAYDPDNCNPPYVVWDAAYQPGYGWTASSGDYYTDHAAAITRMVQRSGRRWHPAEPQPEPLDDGGKGHGFGFEPQPEDTTDPDADAAAAASECFTEAAAEQV